MVIYFQSDVLFSTWPKLGQPIAVYCEKCATWAPEVLLDLGGTAAHFSLGTVNI